MPNPIRRSTYKSSGTAREGEEGQVPSELYEMQKDFTPMVYSVDGIAGREARNAEKRLATQLAGKWNREYLLMLYYVRVRMAIAIVRANSLLICGSRD